MSSRHLTHRFWLCVVAVGVLVTGALLLHELAWLAIASPFALALALSAADGWWPALPQVEVALDSERVVEGDVVTARIEVRSTSKVPWLELELQATEHLTPVGSTRRVVAVPPRSERVVEMQLQAERFGVVGLEWLTVAARDLLGVTETVQHVPLAPSLRVHPPTERLGELLPLRRVRQVTGEHRSRHRGGGTELAEVRAYQPGDPAARIHSRISARRGRPMVLERHPERAADAVLYLDSVQDIGVDLETSLRWTVMAAIALSQRHGRAMDRIGVLDRGAGVRWLPPALGRRALHDIVEVLLRTTALGQHGAHLPSPPHRLLTPGASVFALSPLHSHVVLNDLQQLQRHGHQVIVIEPVVADSPDLDLRARRIHRIEMTLRRADLARTGIATIPWDTREPLEATLRRAGPMIQRLSSVSATSASATAPPGGRT